jgi:hypothetical protein
MKLKYLGLVLVLFVGTGLTVAGCDVESRLPTGSSSLSSMSGGDPLGRPVSPLASEESDCPNIGAFYLRTSDPGSIDGNVVKAWIKLIAAPANATAIRVWWNYNESGGHDYKLEDLPVVMNEDGTINVELLAEHTYPHITGETERTIRAELIVGKDGTHCARVRHITVAPPEEPEKSKPKPCLLSGCLVLEKP